MKVIRAVLGIALAALTVFGLMVLLQPVQAAPVQSLTAVNDRVIISEVFYDPAGSDNNLEWVELYNPTTHTVDLGEYSLGNGGSDYTYSRVQLSGTLPVSGCWVVGGPTSQGTNY